MRGTLLLSMVVLASGALADGALSAPDYSRDALRKTFAAHAIDLPERPGPRFRFVFGGIEFTAWGMDWRLIYLPIMQPLSGSVPGVTKEHPDPFELTQTPIASPKRSWQTARKHNAELRRIARIDRSRSRLSAESQ